MISRRTLIIALLVICVIDMIQAGVFDDFGEAIHIKEIQTFTKNAAQKTGEAATNAYESVKNYFTKTAADGVSSASEITKPKS